MKDLEATEQIGNVNLAKEQLLVMRLKVILFPELAVYTRCKY